MSVPSTPKLALVGGTHDPRDKGIPDNPRRKSPTSSLRQAWRDWLHPFPAGLLVAGCLASLVVWLALTMRIERAYQQRFSALTEQIEQQVEARLEACEQILRGAQGFWSSGARKNPEEWQRYVGSLALEKSYPGISALGFAKPDNELFAQPTAAAAALRARDLGVAALSGLVKIGGEPGFLLVMPVFGGRADSSADRQRNLEGYVYLEFRSRELMQNTLGYRGLYVRYAIYDADAGDPARLLFMTEQPLLADSTLARSTPLNISGHRWTIVSQPGSMLGSPADQGLPRVAGWGGVLLSFLLYALAMAWIRTRASALELAERMTADLKRREQELEELSVQLARSNDDLQQFAYAASHDLKEPLRSIASSLGLIGARYSPKLDDGAREFIGYASDGAQRLSDLIDNLLDFSRVHTHARPFEPVELDAVLDDAMTDLGQLICESGVEIVRSPLPRVYADRAQMLRVMENLLTNAIKYCRRYAASPQIVIAAEPRGPQWVISVTDNGIGIPPEHHERIFQMFKRLHSRAEYEGNGMGLALCKRIIQRHRGEIWVHSTEGEGATFYFSLPPAPPTLVVNRS